MLLAKRREPIEAIMRPANTHGRLLPHRVLRVSEKLFANVWKMSPDKGPESQAIEVKTEFIPRCEKMGVATTNLLKEVFG